MFSGIVETTGKVMSLERTPHGIRMSLRPSKKLAGATQVGQSVAVNGVCLTVVENKKGLLAFDVIKETLKVSNLSDVGIGSLVNMERSLKYGDRIDGHYVLGHAEGKGRITRFCSGARGVVLTVRCPRKLRPFIVYKGCIAIDGISLTVSKVAKREFEVSLIPHTLSLTNFHTRKAGDAVNLETDILLKRRRLPKRIL